MMIPDSAILSALGVGIPAIAASITKAFLYLKNRCDACEADRAQLHEELAVTKTWIALICAKTGIKFDLNKTPDPDDPQMARTFQLYQKMGESK